MDPDRLSPNPSSPPSSSPPTSPGTPEGERKSRQKKPKSSKRDSQPKSSTSPTLHKSKSPSKKKPRERSTSNSRPRTPDAGVSRNASLEPPIPENKEVVVVAAPKYPWKQLPGDETVEYIHRPYSELPSTIRAKIERNGIKEEELVGKKLEYIWHITLFLYRDHFPSGFEVYKRPPGTEERVAWISDEAMEETRKAIKNLDVPLKKIFPTLDFQAEGSFGVVYTGKMVNGINGPKKGKARVAVKKLPHASEKDIQANLTELYFMITMKHPNIVSCLDTYYSATDAPKGKLISSVGTSSPRLMIAMEWLQGGTLQYASNSGGGRKFKDAHIAFVARECFQGIAYMHSRGFAHRDLKSSNIMISVKGEVKLIDFGLACDMSLGRRNKMLGSLMWIPPEMIQMRPHGLPVDIWSMAVCILELYLGGPPLRKKGIHCMLTAATEGFAQFIPPDATDNAKSFLTQCLTMDPDNRPTAQSLLDHPWVNSDVNLEEGIQVILKQVFLARSLNMT